ncbi:MAG: hypothetical protein COA96_04445 [SAR86 cluster bacterium]|uniref:Uncharacterized protein n=1 Tax=SAR86 cluster bacterium TaxID=2030880 RepID=A0A2A5B5R5_9GAMM|nr:MAG: hypothetical protein COA96_04445 [SAR86 cluster bacterium]
MLLTSCSNQQLYKMIQENRLQACEEIPIPQQQMCKSQYQKPYDVYQRELKEIEIEQRTSD